MDEHIGQMWNVLRLTRILLCELISPALPQASYRPFVRLLPAQPRVLRHYHDRSDERRDLCHGTTIHRRLIEFLLQRYYTYRPPASRTCPRCMDLARTASKRKSACTLLQAHLSALCCSTIVDCRESDQAVRKSTAALHGRPSRHRECASRCQNSGI